MPHTLELEEYGHGIGNAGAVLRNNGARAGLEAPVPTCPGWTVRDLVTHLGADHRTAAATITGGQPLSAAQLAAEAAASDDLLAWFDDGLVEILNALGSASPDLDVAPSFVADPAPPRLAWTRAVCHETTVHAVDAMAAALGRAPRREEVWFGARLAADGIDELLMGFLPKQTDIRLERPSRLLVSLTGSASAWTIQVGPEGLVVAGSTEGDADVVVSGAAVDVFLTLWNRGDSAQVVGDLELWRRWREISALR